MTCTRSLLPLLMVVLMFGCTDLPVEPNATSADVSMLSPDAALSRGGRVLNFVATLSAREEVPVNDSKARGSSTFQLKHGSSQLTYRLNVANIHNVLQAHIHCGGAGENGPVVAFLYPSAPPAVLIEGRFSGVLATGTITNANVIPRPDSDICPGGIANFDELIEKMMSGHTYVNVHTSQFPGGEIRGQIDRGNAVR